MVFSSSRGERRGQRRVQQTWLARAATSHIRSQRKFLSFVSLPRPFGSGDACAGLRPVQPVVGLASLRWRWVLVAKCFDAACFRARLRRMRDRVRAIVEFFMERKASKVGWWVSEKNDLKERNGEEVGAEEPRFV